MVLLLIWWIVNQCMIPIIDLPDVWYSSSQGGKVVRVLSAKGEDLPLSPLPDRHNPVPVK